MTKFLAIASCVVLACTAHAFDGILGPFDTVERLSFGFQDSRVEYPKRVHYIFALSRDAWPPSKSYYFTLNNVKIADASAEAKMRRCYELVTLAVRNFRTNPPASPRGIEHFLSISVNGQPAGITLSFWKGALDENPQLAELQVLLESVLPEGKKEPNKARQGTAGSSSVGFIAYPPAVPAR